MFRRLQNNKGVALVILALMIFMLIGFAALAIDVGHLFHVKNQLQAAADAAALAGAAEMTGSDDATRKKNATAAAIRLALQNVADVSYKAGIKDVNGATISPGTPIPVSLNADANTGSPDIEFGNWTQPATPGTAGFTAGGTPLNAIRVSAKRRGDTNYQPKVSNWFAKIFALILGPRFDVTAITARAIAAQTTLKVLPIAVNEYWNETVKIDPKTGSGPPLPGNPYNQTYPNSFMRKFLADSSAGKTSGTLSTMTGNIFGVFGTNANSNTSSFNLNSYIDILFRNRFHTPLKGNQSPPTPATSAWWQVNTAATGTCSGPPNCGALSAIPGLTGSQNSGKYDTIFAYAFTGIPSNVMPPDAVREVIRTAGVVKGTTTYTANNYDNTTDFNDPSNCPYASPPYFSSSGSEMSKKGPSGLNFAETWPKGTKFMVMVYDGTLVGNPDASQANVVTIIGYGIIQVDGYTSTQIKNQGDFAKELNPGGVGGKAGNTLYGHVLAHGLSGQDDPFLIQTPNTPHTNKLDNDGTHGDCSFTALLTSAALNNSTVQLVGVSPDVRYGLTD